MKTLASVVLATVVLTLVGCQSFGRQDAGMVVGGVAGGAAGHALTGGSALGTVGGAVGGAFVGSKLAQ